jgi:lactate dehydrogenase-like 2-hydroxyacid dehydrogenase
MEKSSLNSISVPVSADNKLLSLDNVAFAPHLDWLTQETLEKQIKVIGSRSRYATFKNSFSSRCFS